MDEGTASSLVGLTFHCGLQQFTSRAVLEGVGFALIHLAV